MKHEILAPGVEIYCGDCREVMTTLDYQSALVTDPPYGIKEAAGKNKSRGNLAVARDYGNARWDDKTIDKELLNLAMGAARWLVIFGGNYYELAPSSCWLIWDKENTGDFADCEMAWTNLPKAVRRLRYRWNGMLRANNEPRGDHPTQKPLGVMEWVIQQLPNDAQSILDPFMGSGTTGVAAVKLGRKFIGIEIEPRYYATARERITKAIEEHEMDMFKDQPIECIQPDLLGGK